MSTTHRHIPTLVLFFCIGVLVLEGLYLSQTFDAYTLIMRGEASPWLSLFGQLGNFLKFLLVTVFIFGLIIKERLAGHWQRLLQQTSVRRAVLFLVPHLACFCALLWLTHIIFANPSEAHELPSYLFVLWLLTAAGSVAFWALMFASGHFLATFIKTEKASIAVAACVGFVVFAIAVFAQEFWGPMSQLTFILSAGLLEAVDPTQVVIIPEEKILGFGDFLVNIAPACSGYEGVGLITAFTGVYLFVNRTKFQFPQALLLIPLGAMAIWLLNVVRIALLVFIGHHWSPEVAIGGFHSQAGWLTFILTSLGILWLTSESGLFAKPEYRSQTPSKSTMNLPIATLIPLMTLLAVTLITSAFVAGFDWLYPIRVIAVASALYVVWPHLKLLPYQWRLEPFIAGALVAILWIFMVPQPPEANAEFQQTLEQAPPLLASIWLIFRFIGAAITVPIAEELAFRAYVLCKLSSVEVITRGRIPWSVPAIILSSLAFGALHGAWVAGTVAGIVYAVVRLRSTNISDAIVAHGLTNALLFIYAGVTGSWAVL